MQATKTTPNELERTRRVTADLAALKTQKTEQDAQLAEIFARAGSEDASSVVVDPQWALELEAEIERAREVTTICGSPVLPGFAIRG